MQTRDARLIDARGRVHAYAVETDALGQPPLEIRMPALDVVFEVHPFGLTVLTDVEGAAIYRHSSTIGDVEVYRYDRLEPRG